MSGGLREVSVLSLSDAQGAGVSPVGLQRISVDFSEDLCWIPGVFGSFRSFIGSF